MITYHAILALLFPDGCESPLVVDFSVTPELVTINESLTENIARVKTLLLLPAVVAATAENTCAIEITARLRVTGSMAIWPPQEAYLREKNKLLKEIEEGRAPVEYHRGDPIQQSVLWWSSILELSQDAKVSTGTHSLFASALILSYTLFETLATDLWVRAVNLRPLSLAQNVLSSHLEDSGDDDRRVAKPMIPLADLAEFDFDLRNDMGTLLKERRRVALDSLKTTEEAYHDAFWNPSSDKQRKCVALSEVFKKYRNDLAVLECIRNLLAHRSGLVEDRFRRGMQRLDHDINIPEDGQQLRLDGHIVVRYVKVAIEFSKDLLKFVSEWLQKYPT